MCFWMPINACTYYVIHESAGPCLSLGLGGAAPGITAGMQHIRACTLASSLLPSLFCRTGSNAPRRHCSWHLSPVAGKLHMPHKLGCSLLTGVSIVCQLLDFVFFWPRFLPNRMCMACRNCRMASFLLC